MIFDDNGFVELPVNTKGRDFIVGDLHGQLDRLMAALDIVEFLPNRDRLIAVGDVIDKGPAGESLLRMLNSEPWFYSTLGNHEAMMRGAERGNAYLSAQWARNNNVWARFIPPHEMDQLCEIVDGMPTAIELPLVDGRRVGIVHAEIPVDSAWDIVRSVRIGSNEVEDHEGFTAGGSLVWGRRRAIAGYHQRAHPMGNGLSDSNLVRTWKGIQPVSGIDLVVAGHTRVAKPAVPLVVANSVFIETAAFLPEGWLTILDPLRCCYWQVGGKRECCRGPLPLLAPGETEPFRPTPEQVANASQAEQKELEALLWLIGISI